MTISGGVSLGIYEAGVNWAIIEALKNLQKYELQSVTGASAGAINTVLTALRYCEVEVDKNKNTAINNLFYQTWNIQLADLLPDRDEYGALELHGTGVSNFLEDSIFSRNVYADQLSRISNAVKHGNYRNGCEIDIAIVVTRSEPEFRAFGSAKVKTQVPNQRYIIPLTLVVEGDNNIEKGILFKNNLKYSSYIDRSSDYLFLPEKNGAVEFDTVARAVMASSAFPLVFGRVEMSYCLPLSPSNDREAGSMCPPNHFLDTNHFIDGGLFDNVPVGVAVDLVNAKDTDESEQHTHSYIFLDPDGGVNTSRSDTNPLKPDYSLESQLDALVPLITTLRKQVLAESLADNFGSVDAPQLLLTRRTMPIVGTFLRDFGAFFDKSFFYHDYAAGIVDGIGNVVEYICSEYTSFDVDTECRDGPESLQSYLLNELVFKSLDNTKDINPVCESDTCDIEILVKLIRAFNAKEYSEEADADCTPKNDFLREDNAGYVNQTLSVFIALCNQNYNKFDEFIFALDRLRTIEGGVFKKKKWIYGDEVEFVLGKRLSPWTFGLLEKSLQRLLDLENQYGGDSANTFAGAWAMMPSSENGNRAVLQRNSLLAHLSPDYIGIDGLQSGVAVSWDWAVPLPELNCLAFSGRARLTDYCENHRVMVGVGGHFRRVVNERDRFNTTSAFVGIDFSRPDSFLRTSSGVRLLHNADYLPAIDNDTDFDTYNSIEVYSRFFGNKIEVTLGFEGNSFSFGQDDLSLRIGLYDVDRFLALMCPSCF